MVSCPFSSHEPLSPFPIFSYQQPNMKQIAHGLLSSSHGVSGSCALITVQPDLENPTPPALDTSLGAAQGCQILTFYSSHRLRSYISLHTLLSITPIKSLVHQVRFGRSFIWFPICGEYICSLPQERSCPRKVSIGSAPWRCADLTMAGLWACVCSYMLWGIDSKKKQVGVVQVIPDGSLLRRHLQFKERHQLRWSMVQYQ